MAKVKAPLMSLEARGAIAKTLVHFPWKGINAVREYVIPSNPKSDAQRSQRGKFTEAVDSIHWAQRLTVGPLGPIDVSAYALLASIFKSPRTWFNQIVKVYVDVLRDEKAPVIWQACTLNVSSAKQIVLEISSSISKPEKAAVFWGSSKTALLDSKDLIIGAIASAWEASTPYSVDDECQPTVGEENGHTYKCIVAGDSGATEPDWPTVIGATIVDGDVTWECIRSPIATCETTIPDLASGQKYYLQVRPKADDPCEGAISGIYHTIVT